MVTLLFATETLSAVPNVSTLLIFAPKFPVIVRASGLEADRLVSSRLPLVPVKSMVLFSVLDVASNVTVWLLGMVIVDAAITDTF